MAGSCAHACSTAAVDAVNPASTLWATFIVLTVPVNASGVASAAGAENAVDFGGESIGSMQAFDESSIMSRHPQQKIYRYIY